MPGPATTAVLLVAGLAVLAGLAGRVLAGRRRADPIDRADQAVAERLARSAAFRGFLRGRLDPVQATGLALTLALGVLFLAALGFGLVADMVTSRTGLARLDAAAADWGSRHATPTSTRLLHRVSSLGSTVGVSLVAALAGLVVWARRRQAAAFAYLLAVVAGQNLLANALKLVVERGRPPVAAPLVAPAGYSFPSGHTTAAAATYAAVALVLGSGRRWPVRVWLGAAVLGVLAAVAASRVLLTHHWVTDVVAGAALGLGWFAVCSIAFGGRLLRFGEPVERAERELQARGRLGRLGSPSTRRKPTMPDVQPDVEPTDDQVDARAASLAADPGDHGDDPGAQAHALLVESEERVEDPAARDPRHEGVIRRTSEEGVVPDDPG